MIYAISQLTLRNFLTFVKQLNITLLYKKGSLTQSCNYRPISISPLISEVIQKIIYNQRKTFLNSKNLLYTYQTDFRRKHFTDFCVSFLNDKRALTRVWWLAWFWLISRRPSTQLIMTLAKIICYWFLKTCYKLISILFIQQIIFG